MELIIGVAIVAYAIFHVYFLGGIHDENKARKEKRDKDIQAIKLELTLLMIEADSSSIPQQRKQQIDNSFNEKVLRLHGLGCDIRLINWDPKTQRFDSFPE